ncbi:PEP-CTERM system histidine kinase PrsK [Sphingomonas spermidinifaciens]|uniref:histidine kinase n=1 Tax=Sphingomonas spermidinifaciens TaxID=1141889 RepID=A0A2A4B5S1_9SPHN|nr:XrtA/PEP-CTERM system histidine kinase PrsK [Sphingomonas spermidinifaciens]PCD02994.1 PEP-CTERM system histidine kinase PrsK [Sphingomonas spermidinifaciens]
MTGGALDLLTLWSHSLAALLFSLLAVLAWRGARRRRALAAAFAMTALWALAVAGLGGGDGVTRLAEMLRNLAWLGFLWRTESARAGAETRWAGVAFPLVLAAIFMAGGVVGAAGAAVGDAQASTALAAASVVLRLLACVAALVLVQHVHARALGASVRAAALGIAAMWLIDVNALTLAWATQSWPAAIQAMRGAVMVVVAAVFAADLQRQGDRPVQLSRAVAVQSLSLLAVLSYFAIFAGVTEGLAILGGPHARLLQTAFVFGSTAALLALLASPQARAWLRVKATKHLFRHRYDYRAEWMRFTDTLGDAGAGEALGERVTRAVAELLEAPGGLLLTSTGGTLAPMAAWHWDLPPVAGDDDLAHHLAATGRIIELDAVRAGRAPDDAGAAGAIVDCAEAWAVVPLPHPGGLVGAVVLARPALPRPLDWEDFDLLKVAGRQAASWLAEQQAQARLAEAERFDEFNRRFAFILHDIKNLVSQLSLVARNAERHADNPAFRADMVATLNESATRMTELVARLSQGRTPRTEAPRGVPLLHMAEALATERRLAHPVVATGDPAAVALADPAGVTQILRHLIQNAIEASPPGEPVGVAVRCEGARVVVEVIDRGCGMSPAFVRERLFKPFVSTKPAGFGIGTYEARAIASAMGGAIEVSSVEGEGSRFRLILPSASAPAMEAAA